MKLVTVRTAHDITYAGVVRGEEILLLHYPNLLRLLQDPAGMQQARQLLESNKPGLPLRTLTLMTPVPNPPTLRDFYAFEQHVKAGRARRGLDMIPEWYEFPTFYFSNTSEIYGHDERVPYPAGSRELDIELEIACVIGREGKDIPVDEAANYIAGYTIMNDWSARDFQRQDMKLNLGPGKGKDFATSLGPWLVTPNELADYRTGSGSSERYDLTMLARVDGQEISRGNFNQIYYSFPQLIAYASRNARLRPGDILGSGTVGTGCILEVGTQVHPWLQRGETVELEITGIGTLRNRIV
ncbi:fumarylacetoacetate hydrolase family protein [Dictyobacter formicarum]|uniref:Fumarylacetoacetase n=1 Tax=Dictyobacter formicarum TaxID=2778368 RepID=A0ABQ3VNS4_9CHLR|nr:fumarylacetoacetate hydrolase family protein [Dictyobacter formicarum]GHO87487.1 fumarylacetoacetase [Dictyobacter formicarum]